MDHTAFECDIAMLISRMLPWEIYHFPPTSIPMVCDRGNCQISRATIFRVLATYTQVELHCEEVESHGLTWGGGGGVAVGLAVW